MASAVEVKTWRPDYKWNDFGPKQKVLLTLNYTDLAD